MILEHSINHREIHFKPTIKFNYITPSALPRVYSLAAYPPPLVQHFRPLARSQPYEEITRQAKPSPEGRCKSQRKKIFDRTYTTKGSLLGGSEREGQREKAKSSTGKLNYSVKKQRKAIFSKVKKATGMTYPVEDRRFNAPSNYYRSNQSSIVKLKPPSSLTSYIDIDPLRRERQHYEINVLRKEHEDPFWMDRVDQNISNQDISSEVKVDISDDSDTSKSISCSHLPAVTQERFFDKDLTNEPPRKQQKLSEVNLYSTTVNGSFGRHTQLQVPSLFQNIKKLLNNQVKQNLLAYLLIVMGVFLLLVQVSN